MSNASLVPVAAEVTASADALPELSCRPLKSMFLAFRSLKTEAQLRAALARAGVALPLEFLEDEANWISFSASQRILDALSEDSGVADFPARAGRLLATPEVLGLAYSMLKAFGTVRLCYSQTLRLSNWYNKVGQFRVLELGADHLHLEYESTIREPNKRFCDFRAAQFTSFPQIWGLPLARVREEQCQAEGARSCRYLFEWQRRPMFRDALLGAMGGLSTAGLLVHAGVFDVPLLVGAGAGATLGGMIGALLDSRRELRDRDSLLARQNADLIDSVQRLSQRYGEITELNRTLEQRVDERTAELAAARDKLQSALARAVALDRAKTQFFTNISHELRTPLTLILAPLETALHEWEAMPDEARGQLELMHRNGVRLLENINQLLDISRLDAGRARLKLEDLDGPGLLKSLVEASDGLARARGVELRFEQDGPVPPVPADRDKLEKIALNLIGNALKFTRPSPEKPHPWVLVRCGAENGRFVFHVSDTGIGIPQDQLQTIFERFSQISAGDGREFGGTGIGLALAKELAEFHVGSISVSSLEGVGSTFTVSLPLSREAIPQEHLDRRREQKDVVVDRRAEQERARLRRVIKDVNVLELQHLTPPPELKQLGDERPTLLLADDNLDMLGFLARLLQRDYRVLTASDGEQALLAARRERPALIVSDVMMPRMDGYELVRALRASQDTRHMPVILLTAKNEVAQRVHGLEEGADDYLSKPFNFLEFKARVKALLKSRELERQLAEKNEYLEKLNFDLVLSKKEVFLQTIEAITYAVEAKDTYTHGHSYRVALLAQSLAKEMKLSEAEVERVRVSALLHDVGKIGIRDGLLNKPGRLTPEEYLEIQKHPEIGARILEAVKELKDVTRCVKYHHEAWDGSGYPGKLRAREIPLESRVIAVADTYDAMTSDRAYRKGLGHARAMEEIRDYAGRQFDPEIVKCFVRLYEKEGPEFPAFPSAFKVG